MIQRKELASKFPPNSKTQEENENAEMSLFNILNSVLAAGGRLLGPFPGLQAPINQGMVSREPE